MLDGLVSLVTLLRIPFIILINSWHNRNNVQLNLRNISYVMFYPLSKQTADARLLDLVADLIKKRVNFPQIKRVPDKPMISILQAFTA